MKTVWALVAIDDYRHWQKTDPRMITRIQDLVADIKQTPFCGKGKPEPLKGNLAGNWSRRITGGHRLVYRVSGTGVDQVLEILQCRYHY